MQTTLLAAAAATVADTLAAVVAAPVCKLGRVVAPVIAVVGAMAVVSATARAADGDQRSDTVQGVVTDTALGFVTV